MSLAIVSFLAGMLSVLAPCVLPVLPVILGSSLSNQQNYRPVVIVISTAIFITIFTFLLKASTSLINIPTVRWTYLSAIIIIIYGVFLIRPETRDILSMKIWLHKSNKFVNKAKSQWGILWDILLWASLWPIFASCSPTYALLLSVVFPQSITAGLWYTLLYSSWFAVLLLIFAYGWRSIIKRFHRASASDWRFKKILWYILIITGLLIATGYMKELESKLLDQNIYNISILDQKLLDKVSIQ